MIKKKKKILSILFFTLLCSCSENTTPIVELINIQEWDSVTIVTLKEKVHLDMMLQYNDSFPPLLMQDGKTVVKSFDEEIIYYLSFREKIMEILREKGILSNAKNIYIFENQSYGANGYNQSFIVLINKKKKYYFKFDELTDSFSMEEEIERNKETQYYWNIRAYSNNIEFGRMSGLSITTLIKRNRKNTLSYDIISVSVK